MLLLENLSCHENPFPNSSHASCLKHRWACKRFCYLTETKFFMLAFSSHNIFNSMPFTLIQLAKFDMQMQCKPLQQRPSWARLPVRTKIYSSFSIAKLYRKTYTPTLTLPGELQQIWFCHLKRSLPFHQEHLPQLSYMGQPVLPGTGVIVRWRWVVLECLTLILPLLCPRAGLFPWE